MGLGDVPGERDEQPDRLLGGGHDRGVGRVGDDDPPARRRLDVDVVHSHSRAPDYAKLVRGLHQVGRYFRFAAND